MSSAVGAVRRARLLRLYPRTWRDRYEAEVVAVLELARGLARAGGPGPWCARRAPARAVARPGLTALVCGGLWTFIGAGIVAQPVPPDWPGYLLETLPIAFVAVVAGASRPSAYGARRSDAAGRPAQRHRDVAVVAQVAWAAATRRRWRSLGLPEPASAGQAIGALGVLVVGLVILSSRRSAIGGLLVLRRR